MGRSIISATVRALAQFSACGKGQRSMVPARLFPLSRSALLRGTLAWRAIHGGRMAASGKPYVFQHSEMHPELQAMLDGEFHMVQPGEEGSCREKVAAIFVWVRPAVSGQLIASFPNLKVVGNCAVGYDHIDLKTCAERGVRVGYTPGVLNKTTADMAWALLLSCARRVVEGDAISKSPETAAFDLNWLGHQVSGTTLGIVGMGRIGYEVARRAVGFDMNVLYHNRHPRSSDEEKAVNATYVPSLLSLLEQSDYVVLSAPATEETCHMMSRDQFQAMKKSAVFVNVSRGTLVDQIALAEALKNGSISAAGLDVTDPEPLPRDHALLTLPNVTITPHTASATIQTRQGMVQMTIDNIKAALQGQPMVNEVTLPSK